MDFKELKSIVEAGENQYVEFKRKATHPDKIMKEIVAFANTGGGTLFIGIEDNRTIPALLNPDEEEFIIENAIRKYCYPAISYTLERVRLTEKFSVLAFYIKEGNQKPYYVLHDFEQKLGKAYVRVADRSIQASREMREILKMERKGRNFKFQYGDKERILMQYLEENKTVSIEKFAEMANINTKQASRTLVLLVLAGVLRLQPEEVQDIYFRTRID